MWWACASDMFPVGTTAAKPHPPRANERPTAAPAPEAAIQPPGASPPPSPPSPLPPLPASTPPVPAPSRPLPCSLARAAAPVVASNRARAPSTVSPRVSAGTEARYASAPFHPPPAAACASRSS